MDPLVVIPGITAAIALLMAVLLVDQWRVRRRTYQIVWAVGMACFGIASGCEAIAAASGWNETLYKAWYLTGAVWTAGWLGLGTAFLLARTRFGYTYAFCLALAGVFTLLTQRRFEYEGAGLSPFLYLIAALAIAVGVAFETYFASDRWPRIAAIGVVGATALSIVLVVGLVLPPPGYALDPVTGMPTGELFPGTVRLLTPFMNITGGLALAFGALFSAYVFMPKRRVLAYSLDPRQSGDQMLFNLLIAPFAIAVNFIASIPGALRAFRRGELHSRVPATILIAIGGFTASGTDALNRFGSTELFQVGKLISAILLFAGFLVSIEVFSEFRIPFTDRRVGSPRREATAGPEAGRP